MLINKSCPIVYNQVDQNILRLNAFMVFSCLLCFIFTLNLAIVLFITLDFVIRVFFGLKYSPICFFIKKGLRYSGIKPHLTNAGPKLFAAKIGLMFSVLILIFYLIGFFNIALGIAILFLLASGLDAFFNICIACEIYPYYRKFLYK